MEIYRKSDFIYHLLLPEIAALTLDGSIIWIILLKIKNQRRNSLNILEFMMKTWLGDILIYRLNFHIIKTEW